MNKFTYDTPVGKIHIAEQDGKISIISFSPIKSGIITETPVIKKARLQLDEYFKGQRKEFDLPLLIDGTEFQKKVWQALMTIPYGKTESYKDIAIKIGNPNAQRAVGMANHNNRIIIVIPCHRVIGSNGSLTGYGEGLEIKQFLLDLEGGN